MQVHLLLDRDESTSIAEFHWDARTETAVVHFRNGGVYMYSGVTRELFMRFVQADSLGTFFYHNIRSLAFTKVDVPRKGAADASGDTSGQA